MCFKEIQSYTICGCLDTVAHIRTCADRLLKDDLGNGYGYSRCPVAELALTIPEKTLRGYCPRCALNNLVLVKEKLVKMPATAKIMAPITRLPLKTKNGEVKKSKNGQASSMHADTKHESVKSGGQQDAVSTYGQTQPKPADIGGMTWK